MKRLKIYTGSKTYMFPNGVLATKEVMLEKYPAIAVFKHVIETDNNEEVIFGISNLSAMRSRYNISPELTDDDALSAIEELINAKPAERAPTAEERIAAALEYQNLLAMEDIE